MRKLQSAREFPPRALLTLPFVLALAITPACLGQQPLLQVTLPTNGTIVNPGQTVTVSVTSPAGASFSGVFIIGEKPIGFSDPLASVPAQFSIAIPPAIDAGPYMLTAMAATSSGQSAQSAPVLIDVERPDMPTGLSAQTPGNQVTLEALGQQFPIILFAAFSDGSVLAVTQSSYVTYSSSDTSIATVDSNGMITGISAGTATITATYSLAGQTVQTMLSVSVSKQVMDVSPTTLNFGSQNVGTSSASQQLTVTNAGAAPLKILSLTAGGDFLETDNCASSSPLAAGGTCTINVTFTPGAAAARSGKLTVANGFSIIPSSIGLSGTGIGQPTTATVVTSSANPSVFGQSVTLTATVSSSGGTPTGSVTFTDGSTTLGSAPLANGQATLASSSFSIGQHSITASYGGDGTYQGSSGSLTQSVNPASTTTTVSPSANPSILNASVTFTANVSVVSPGTGTPTGSITFKSGSTVLATVPISSAGQATFSTSSLPIGAQSITASYSGDSNFAASTSSTLNQAVQYEPVGSSCDGDAGHQILQPIYSNGTSVFNQGRTVPAKFRVCDANGNAISSAATVTSFLLTQIVSGTVTTNVEDVVDTNNPDTAFRWDSTDQQWIFNISTQSLSANQTYVYTITLNDGTTIVFQFGLK
jgi:hypothetical protein